MSLIAGTVAVADDGTETFTPSSAANLAKGIYEMLLSVNSTAKMAQKSVSPATWSPPKPPISNPPTPDQLAAMRAWQAGNPTMTPPPPATTTMVTKTITPDPTTKQKQAEFANGFATAVRDWLVANAVVTIAIPATSAGDGLQTSQSPGDPTTHPASAKTMTGGLS
jgi:hypothetical protein